MPFLLISPLTPRFVPNPGRIPSRKGKSYNGMRLAPWIFVRQVSVRGKTGVGGAMLSNRALDS